MSFVNLFLTDVPILYPPKNTRKSLVFWYIQGVYKWELARNALADLSGFLNDIVLGDQALNVTPNDLFGLVHVRVF